MDPVAKNVDEYLATQPEEVRDVLEKLRDVIKSVIPNAQEVISYQIPAFRYLGPLVAFAGFRGHCSLFTISKSVMETYKDELKPYKTAGVTIHFHPDDPLPDDLIKKIVRARVKENEERNRAKKTK